MLNLKSHLLSITSNHLPEVYNKARIRENNQEMGFFWKFLPPVQVIGLVSETASVKKFLVKCVTYLMN